MNIDNLFNLKMRLKHPVISRITRNWIFQLKSASSISEILKKAIINPIVDFLLLKTSLLLRLSGLKFKIPDRKSFYSILRSESWMAKYAKLNSQSVAIDIGAHVGKYTVQWAKICKKILAFEPDPVNFRYLTENIRLNRIEKKVKAFNVALSNFDRYGILYRSKVSDRHSLIPSSDCIGKCKIKIRTLDNVLINEDINQIDLIKIDVEGAELEVLQGSKSTLKQFKPHLIIEVRHKNREAVVNFLISLGYNIKTIPESVNSICFYLSATTN